VVIQFLRVMRFDSMDAAPFVTSDFPQRPHGARYFSSSKILSISSHFSPGLACGSDC
jgi:hypothetical protein